MRLLALAALLPSAALAAPVVLTWTQPTQYTDGTALPLSAITRSRTEYGTCGGTASAPTFGTKAGEQIVNTNAATVTIDRPVGTHCFRTAVTASGQESAFSNVARKVVQQPPPNPPTSLTVQEDTTAFVIVKSRDRLALVPVGNVAPGTQCDSSQQVLGRFVVPRASVTFVSSVQDEVVLAACG